MPSVQVLLLPFATGSRNWLHHPADQSVLSSTAAGVGQSLIPMGVHVCRDVVNDATTLAGEHCWHLIGHLSRLSVTTHGCFDLFLNLLHPYAHGTRVDDPLCEVDQVGIGLDK